MKISILFCCLLVSMANASTFNYVAPSFANKNIFQDSNFALIKGTTFSMGSPESEIGHSDFETQHEVTITKDFQIQKTVVTQGQFFEVMGYNPSYTVSQYACPDTHLSIPQPMSVLDIELCPNNPVEYMSWNHIQKFIEKLNTLDSKYTYRLPTEAEWELSARGGTISAFFWGDTSENVNEYVHTNKSTTMPVGLKKPNSFGLYDLVGNIKQLVSDKGGRYGFEGWDGSDVCWTTRNCWEESSASRIDPIGSNFGDTRTVRGGSYGTKVENLRSASRAFISEGDAWTAGIRLVRVSK